MQTATAIHTKTQIVIEPFSMSVKDASKYFGISSKTINNWIYTGRLQIGRHYAKHGTKTFIIVQAMKKHLFAELINVS